MRATFDPALGTDRDWLRLTIGDQVVASAVLEDESIDAILAAEKNKYLAAARCAEIVMVRWQAKGGGVTEKMVDKLRIRRAGGGADSDYRAHIEWLRQKGAQEMAPVGRRFMSLL